MQKRSVIMPSSALISGCCCATRNGREERRLCIYSRCCGDISHPLLSCMPLTAKFFFSETGRSKTALREANRTFSKISSGTSCPLMQKNPISSQASQTCLYNFSEGASCKSKTGIPLPVSGGARPEVVERDAMQHRRLRRVGCEINANEVRVKFTSKNEPITRRTQISRCA